MSEKQFIISKNTGERFPTGIIDVERQTHLWVVEVVDLLNELVKDNEELGISIKLFEDDVATKDKKIEEQQSTIKELQSIINHIKCEEDCFDYDYCCETVCSLYNEIKHLKEENEQLRLELETHKHPLWSTREAERKLSEVTNNLANEVKKNGLLHEEINQLRIENMRLKKKDGDGV